MHPVTRTITLFYAFLFALASAFFFFGCGEPAPEEDPIPERYWSDSFRPVTVFINRDGSQECQDAAMDGVQFWRDHGVTYLLTSPADRWHRAVSGTPGRSEIGVTFGELDGVQTGFSSWERTASGMLISGHMTLYNCAAQTAAHELGHLLGLDHTQDMTRLMWGGYCLDMSCPEPWDVTAEELEWVR